MDENIPNYAGFWRRFAAYMLDSAVIAWGLTELFANAFNQVRAQFAILQTNKDSIPKNYESMELYTSVFLLLIMLPFVWAYFSGMESSPLRATLGKLAVGIYVTDMDGQRISFGKATGRFFGKLISGLMIGIGYLIAGLSETKQALHDLMAGCLVLSR